MDLTETGCDVGDWIHMTQDMDKFAGSYQHGNKPSSSIKCGEFHDKLRNY
jgi:hypothetical protein